MAAASAVLSWFALDGFGGSCDSVDEGKLVGSGTRRRFVIRRCDEHAIVVAKSTDAERCSDGALAGNRRVKLYFWLDIGVGTERSFVIPFTRHLPFGA